MDSRFRGHGNKVSISWGKPEKSSDSKVPLKGRDIRLNFQEGTIWDLFSFASLSCKIVVVTVAGSFVIQKCVQESLDRGSHHPTSQLITYIQLYRILIFQVLHRMYINRKQSKYQDTFFSNRKPLTSTKHSKKCFTFEGFSNI